MSLVHIGRHHRADYATDLSAVGALSYTVVIDTQPNLLEGDRHVSALDAAQCSRCTLLDFLAQVPNLRAFPALAELRTFFAGLPELMPAIATGDAERVRRIGEGLGARSCFEIVPFGAQGQLRGIAKLEVVRAKVLPNGERGPRGASDRTRTALVEPGSGGPAWLIAQLRALEAAGVSRAFIGYHEHASAMDAFSAFVERDDFRSEWQSLLLSSRAIGFEHLGLAMAFPPCATLKVGPNIQLEALRARLDLQFRRLDADASMMCPENVSGYGLTHDTRAAFGAAPLSQTRCAIRHANLIFTF